MPTTVKTGWLNDKNGDKFAPKTLASQVQTSDGVLLEDKIQADLDAIKEEILNNVPVEVDDELSPASNNPVQNKVINAEIDAINAAIDSLEEKVDNKLDNTTVLSTYETKADADMKLDEAKSYTDTSLLDYYTKIEIDNMELITVDDIDEICDATMSTTT